MEVSPARCFCRLCTSAQHFYSDINASWTSLYITAVSTLFKMAAIEGFLFVCLFFGVNEGQLTLLSFPKEANTRQRLIAFLFPADLFHVNLITSSTSTWAALTAKLLLKDPRGNLVQAVHQDHTYWQQAADRSMSETIISTIQIDTCWHTDPPLWPLKQVTHRIAQMWPS